MNLKPSVRRYLAKIGRKGGQVKSPAKAEAVRRNGLLGGRPRKDGKQAQARTERNDGGDEFAAELRRQGI